MTKTAAEIKKNLSAYTFGAKVDVFPLKQNRIISDIVDTLGSVGGSTGALTYKGTWEADSNTPELASGVGTQGDYYVVSIAGSTNLDGITDWEISDWAVFNGTVWQKVDNSEEPSENLSNTILTQSIAASQYNMSGTQSLIFANTGTGATSFQGDTGIDLHRESSTAGHRVKLGLYLDDDGGNKTQYGAVESFIIDSADGTEDGGLYFKALNNGSEVEVASVNGLGNFLVGSGNPGVTHKFEVDGGSTLLTGADSAAGTKALFIENSSGTDALRVTNDGRSNFGTLAADANALVTIEVLSATGVGTVWKDGTNNLMQVGRNGAGLGQMIVYGSGGTTDIDLFSGSTGSKFNTDNPVMIGSTANPLYNLEIRTNMTSDKSAGFRIRNRNTKNAFIFLTEIGGNGNNLAIFDEGTETKKISLSGTADSYFINDLGIGTSSVNASAALEVSSTTKGFRITPMTATQASAMTAVEGLFAFVSDTNGTFTSIGLWVYENAAWSKK